MSFGGSGPVLHSLDLGEVGGLFRVVEMLATAQAREGIDVHVNFVVPAGRAPHPLEQSLERAGATIHRTSLPARAYRIQQQRVRQLLGNVRPSVLHTHGYRSDVLDARVAIRNAVPVVSTVHGFTGGDWRNRAYEWLQRRAFRGMNAVVAVSRPLYDELRAGGLQHLHLVPNRLLQSAPSLSRQEAREALGLAGDRFHIGWVGRISREKGPDIFVDAVRGLCGSDTVAAVIGDGPARPALETSSGGGVPIQWLGAVDGASRFFPAFDLFVMSSRTEGTPIVILEAMAAGIPIVAPKVGGIPHMLSEAEAFLVEPENPQVLRSAILYARDHRDEAARRARAARARIEAQSVSSWVAEYAAVYKSAKEART